MTGSVNDFSHSQQTPLIKIQITLFLTDQDVGHLGRSCNGRTLHSHSAGYHITYPVIRPR